MSWFSQLFSNGLGNLVEKLGNTVDKFNLSDEEKQNFTLEMQQLILQRESEIGTNCTNQSAGP